MNEKYLPIGSVVLLKNGKKEIMINSYCVYSTTAIVENKTIKEPDQKLYEYGGCAYPEGITQGDVLIAFDHVQIEKVLFKGYVTAEQQKISKVLNEALSKK